MRQAPATLLLTSAWLGAASSAAAAEWSAAPALGWTVDHDSNRALSTDEKAGQGTSVQMDLLLKRATPGAALSLRPHLTLRRYNHDSARDSNDESVQAAGLWRMPRSVLSVQASVAHQNTLDTALIGSEVVGIDTRRRSKVGSLAWTHEQAKALRTLTVELGYADIAYDGNGAYRLSDYHYPSVSITQSIGWSPRSSIQLTAYGTRLDSDAGYRSESVGAQLGVSHAISERLSASLGGGYSRQRIERSFGPFTFASHESGYTGRAQLTRRDVLGQWRLFAERSVTASGFATLVTRTEAGLALDRRLAPRWTTSISLRSVGNTDIGSLNSGEAHRYQRFETTVGWRASRTWTLHAAANVNRLERTAHSPTAEGWRVALSANWVPVPRVLSR